MIGYAINLMSPAAAGITGGKRLESTIVMINLFGAVALLLFGLAQVKDGMTRAFGVKLRSGLALGTRGPVRSFLAGFVATVVLQSSSATALMVSSFVERNLMRARMAQIVLLGANVGTTEAALLHPPGSLRWNTCTPWLAPACCVSGLHACAAAGGVGDA